MKQYAVFVRLLVGIMLMVFWGLVDSPLLGVVFMLLLLGASAARYRLFPYPALGIFEAVICVSFTFLWPPALLGLWLPILGLLEKQWDSLERELLSKDYADRAERFRLESDRETLRGDIQNASRLAEMAERSRIAQEIHDHVGHEISGASIALQTAIKLYEKNDERTGEVLNQTAKRLRSAAEHLRETVHNLKPARMPGVWSLEELCDSFGYCPVQFTSSGDLSGITFWELLAANLKETLTNMARHSDATLAAVRLDGNAGYIRMTVTDNGKATGSYKMGMGLSGIRERVRSAGGSLAVNMADGFQVVCVIPKVKKDGEFYEASDC